ncbi:NAD(P)H-dependent oxidoreductase subunit E [Pontiellaceae bacterium B1224]|nr:NAD(P)H-dependent oxidoreductase subunit E [Pontiellaceae bacterium B1224]
MIDDAISISCTCEETYDSNTQFIKLDEILAEYKYKDGGLIPVLQIAQGLFGYLPDEVLRHIAKNMDKPYSEVAGVVSFYSFFSTQPRGKYVIKVCLGTACYVRGGKQVLDAIKKELAVDVGETTTDKLFSLEVARCFGACGLAPAIMINDDVHQRVKPTRIKQILSSYYKFEEEGLDHA